MTNIQVLSLVVGGFKKLNNLSARQAAALAQEGFIGVADDQFSVTPKGERAHKRNLKGCRAAEVQLQVAKTLEELPVGKPFRHRGLWLRMGQTDFTRDEVLTGLKVCRELGVVKSVKLSNNNFQIVWFTGDEMITETAEEVEEVAAAAK